MTLKRLIVCLAMLAGGVSAQTRTFPYWTGPVTPSNCVQVDPSATSTNIALSQATNPCGTGGGAGNPSLPFASVQFNNSGAFGGDPLFAYNAVTHALAAGNLLTVGGGSAACGTFTSCIGAGIGSGAPSLTLFPYTLRFNSGGQIIPVANNVVTVTPDYQFTACDLNCPIVITGATTISPGSVTATLTPCPIGVNGTDNPHYLALTGGGITEYVLITGGTCTSGSSSGTISFTAAYSYGANYQITSATSGIQEAWETLTPPGITLKLMPQTNYTIYAEAFMPGGASTLDGQGASITCTTNMSCINVGKGAAFGATGGGEGYELERIVTIAGTTPWSATISGSVSGSSPTATLTIPTCPSGFWANIPNQILWLAGTYQGLPTTVYGYGEFVVTTGGGSTCAPGVLNGTINIAQATPGAATNLSPHDSGSSISNGDVPAYEDAAQENAHFHDIKWDSPLSTQVFGFGFMFNNDQAAAVDNIDMEAGSGFRKDADFQSDGIFAPGPSGSGSAILVMGPNVNIGSSLGSCVRWYSGNDFTSVGENVCQDFSAGGIVLGNKRGGFGTFFIDGGVHFEQAGVSSPWGVCLGNPSILMVGGQTQPFTNLSHTFGSGVFGGNQDSSYCTFPPTVAAQTTNLYYYLVAHTNTATNCTSGGDCTSVPVFDGDANINAPNTNPVTVSWYGWGTNPAGSLNNQVSSYDLLRVSAASSAQPPAAPQGTGNYLVASGITPASNCNIHNVCSFVDNVASPTSYTVNTALDGSKNFYPIAHLIPGIVALTGNGHAGTAPLPAVSGNGGMNYRGTPTCINDMEYFGSLPVANFPMNSLANEADVGFDCPNQYAPILNEGVAGLCLSSGSPALCINAKQGSVTIAAGQTTVVVDTTAIQPWSHVLLTENMTQCANLGLTTCNTTLGRTYAVTAVSYGVSFTITASAAPSTYPAVLDFQIK